jgi:CP family cyanate transporter-like MFS transporter
LSVPRRSSNSPNERSGRWLALFAIGLLALNLRTAVASLSPILEFVQQDFTLSIIQIAVIGAMAPVAFGASGIVTRVLVGKTSVELALRVLLFLIIAGGLLRGIAWDGNVLFVGSTLALLGMGIGNVLLPSLVRRYFPNRIGLLTSFYITMTSISATLPPLIAVPIAEATGWRNSLLIWVLAAALAAPVVWSISSVSRRSKSAKAIPSGPAIWRSPTAWAIAGLFSLTSTIGYTSFAWLPQLMKEHSGLDTASAGAMLGLFALMGFLPSLLVPIAAERWKRSQLPIVLFSILSTVAGSVGLIFYSSTLVWLWVVLIGLGPTMFPLALALFNLRSEKRSTVLRVSAFGTAVAYSVSASMVVLAGLLRQITGGWQAHLWTLTALALLSLIAAYQISKMRSVDSELNSRRLKVD